MTYFLICRPTAHFVFLNPDLALGVAYLLSLVSDIQNPRHSPGRIDI